jgi:hypothetical protein
MAASQQVVPGLFAIPTGIVNTFLIDALDLPHLRAAMLAVDAELTAGGLGGPLPSESLANLLAVHLLRHVLAPRQPARRRYGTLPQARLRAVVEYVEE